MTRGALVSTVVVLVGLTLLNLWFWPDPELAGGRSSLGRGRLGHAAVYDLLSELGYPVGRSTRRPELLPQDQPLWLIAPRPQRGIDPEAPGVLAELDPWLQGGGVAVVFGDASMDWSMLGLDVEDSEGVEFTVMPGGLSPHRRILEVPYLRTFGSEGQLATVAGDAAGQALIVEVRRGAGLLVAVADHRFLENPRLPDGDAAVLAVDIVRAYGAPWIDERFHGLRESPSLVEVLGAARLSLVVLFTALALVGIAARRCWPPRIVSESEGSEPTLRVFVEALTGHYAGTRDHPSVFAAYLEGFKYRLHRQRVGDRQLSESGFEERLARDPALDAETRLWLLEGGRPTGRVELVRAVRALERFAEARG